MQKSYRQFCPVAQAADILTERWTPLVLRELLAGSTHFNELRRGVPIMSPSLLSKRLRSLQAAGVIDRVPEPAGRGHQYRLTRAGEELRPIIEQMGIWGARWVESALTERNLDAGLLMWDIRRNIDGDRLSSDGRAVVQFRFTDAPKGRREWWLVAEPGETQLCLTDPGYQVDMIVESDLLTLTRVWTGDLNLGRALEDGRIRTMGDRRLKNEFPDWLRESPFAPARRGRNARTPERHSVPGR